MTKLAAQGDKIEGLQQTFARLQNEITKTYQKFSETSAYTILNALLAGLANNFTLVFNSAKALGELWAASKVLNYVSGVLRLNTALGATKVATDAATGSTAAATIAEAENTAAQVANTAAREGNVAATIAQTAANRSNASAWNELATGLGAVGPRAVQAAEGASLASRAFGLVGTAARGVTGLIGGLPGLLLLVALNAREMGTAIGETTAKWAGWGKTLDANEKKLKAQADAEHAAYEAAQKLSESTVKLMASYTDLTVPLQKSILASEKRLKAIKDEADATNGIIALSGNQKLILDQVSASSLKTAAAAQTVADMRNKESDATATLVAALHAHEQQVGKLSDGERKQLVALQATLDVQRAAADEAQAAADKLATVAAAAKLAADSYGDLSGKLDTLRKNYQDTQVALDVARKGLQDGSVTQENYNKLLRDAAVAEGLFKKSIDDTQAALARKVSTLQNDLAVQNANTNAKIAASKASQAFYRSIGDEASAIREKITQDELEEAQLRKSSAAKLEEAKLMQQAAEQELADARAKGTLTEALQAEIEKRLANAKAMAIEAGAEKSRISEIDSETAALRRQAETQERLQQQRGLTPPGGPAPGGTSGGSGPGTGGASGGSGGTPAPSGYSGSFNNAVPLDQIYAILQKRDAGQLTTADIAQVQAALAQAKDSANFLHGMLEQSAGSVSGGAIQSAGAQLTAIQQLLDSLNAQKASEDAAAGTAPTSGVKAPSGASTSHTVNITLNGASTTINTATASDASALASLMSQLAAAAKTAQPGG
jgi:hypothetical protein